MNSALYSTRHLTVLGSPSFPRNAMSTPTVSHDYIGDQPPAPRRVTKTQPNLAWRAVRAVASIRLTVVLFALSMVLVFFGTLGMMQHSIEETMKNYFRSWLVMIEFQTIADFGKVFIPGLFSPDSKIPGRFPFPGGYIIGWLMFFNLAAAHAIRFKLSWKRSGIFLLHAGVVVLLAGEFLTGQLAVETRMSIKEGGSSRFIYHTDQPEFSVVDSTLPDHDEVVVVPGGMIQNASKQNWSEFADVPFDVQLLDYFPNSDVRNLRPGDETPATAGLGLAYRAHSVPKIKGTDTDSKIDMPSVYVKLRGKQGAELGSYMFSTHLLRSQSVKVGEKVYQVAYRFKRSYQPFEVFLDEATHDVYPGTSIPKDYASTVRVDHPQLGQHGPIRIWMNHPMYYDGLTYYQSGMYTDPETGVKTTTLQVVENPAWTFPYFACGMVGFGMIFHFLIRLIAFLNSTQKLRAAAQRTMPTTSAMTSSESGSNAFRLFTRYFPYAFISLCVLMLLGRGMTPSPRSDRNDLYGFGTIPVQHAGRTQPLDSFARNTLVVISSKQEFVDTTANDKVYKAIDWLLIVWSQPERADKFRIFRCDHPEVLTALGLPQRPGSYRYSNAELRPNLEKLAEQADVASMKPKEKQSHYDMKMMELAKHVQVYRALVNRQNPGLIPGDDPKVKWTAFPDGLKEKIPAYYETANKQVRTDLTTQLHKDRDLIVELVHKHLGDTDVEAMAKRMKRTPEEIVRQVMEDEIKERTLQLGRDMLFQDLAKENSQLGCLQRIVNAYKAEKPPMPAEFNEAVKEYHEQFTEKVSSEDKSRVKLEAWMNFFDPFLQCMALYIAVIILAALSWLVWNDPLRKTAFALACLTLAVHTGALLARMYIGNRPPVTNLYSSAVFIGWGALILCLILEQIYKLGIGSFVGAFVGFCTMLIARFLAESGDTLQMLEAVLDTNFWLATHVTCVTMGYVATFVAGNLACVYIIGGVFSSGMRDKVGKMAGSMIYGTLCFATLLSFVGTVLGGIWADQSWGRFWGWDPKENGAVLIVIWNALILHARWSGLVKVRGMAVLAVFGNMVTAWSWFGTNQLGIGLHAYGFDNRLAIACSLYWVSQGLIIALGSIPLRFWASFTPAAKA